MTFIQYFHCNLGISTKPWKTKGEKRRTQHLHLSKLGFMAKKYVILEVICVNSEVWRASNCWVKKSKLGPKDCRWINSYAEDKSQVARSFLDVILLKNEQKPLTISCTISIFQLSAKVLSSSALGCIIHFKCLHIQLERSVILPSSIIPM